MKKIRGTIGVFLVLGTFGARGSFAQSQVATSLCDLRSGTTLSFSPQVESEIKSSLDGKKLDGGLIQIFFQNGRVIPQKELGIKNRNPRVASGTPLNSSEASKSDSGLNQVKPGLDIQNSHCMMAAQIKASFLEASQDGSRNLSTLTVKSVNPSTCEMIISDPLSASDQNAKKIKPLYILCENGPEAVASPNTVTVQGAFHRAFGSKVRISAPLHFSAGQNQHQPPREFSTAADRLKPVMNDPVTAPAGTTAPERRTAD